MVFGTTTALVAYVGLSHGGYDLLVWAEVGVLVWVALLLAALLGVAWLGHMERTAVVALACLGGLTAWVALGLTWADSPDNAFTELARILTYSGLFIAALAGGRSDLGRSLVAGVAAGLAIVGAVALLSRLHPAWFTVRSDVPPVSESNRLQYPLDYFNGLAAMLALAITLLSGFAATARRVEARAVAASAVPGLALALYYTLSRGGLVTLIVGLVVLVLLVRDRLPKLLVLLVPAACSVVLIVAAGSREAVEAGLRNAVARQEGDELLVMTVLVCLAAGLLTVLVSVGAQYLPRGWQPERRSGAGLAAAAVGVALAAFLLAGGPSAVSDGWRDFRQSELDERTSSDAGRLLSLSGRGRYQLWRSAFDAAGEAPLAGIGPGGYEYWWAQHGRGNRFLRNAHSQYLETLAELGIVGLVLLLGFVGTLLVGGGRLALRGRDRSFRAVCVAGCAAFATSIGVDWVWHIPVIPMAALLVAGVAVAQPPSAPRADGPSWSTRLPLAAVALVALLVLLSSLIGTSEVRSSERAIRNGQLTEALASARTAERAQPYAGRPKLQRALVEERRGRFRAARAAAREATRADPLNWRAWLVRSRVESRAGRTRAALASYRRARSLNPRSVLFDPRP